MNTKFVVLALLAMLMAMVGLYGTTWYYDFGTGSDSYAYPTYNNQGSTTYLQNQPTGGGTHYVHVGNNGGGGLYRDDPGLSDLGTGAELRIAASTGTGSGNVNKYCVYDYTSGGQVARVGYMRTLFRIGSSTGGYADDGTFYYFWGDGTTSFTSNGNIPATDEAFVGMRFVLGTSGTITTSWMVDNAWTSFDTYYTFQQGVTYVVEFFASNGNGNQSNSYICNGTAGTVTTPTIDVWINGTLVADEIANAWTLNKNIAFESWMFYGEGSTGNAANLFIDTLVWANDLETDYTPVYYDYYSKSTGDLTTYATWGTNLDGSGAQPGDFTTAGKTYHIRNTATKTIGANWAVSGTGSKVILGDGVNACTFTVPSAYSFTGTIDVSNLGILDLQYVTPPTLGTLYDGSTVRYNYAGNQNVYGVTYYNLDIYNTGTKTMQGNVTVNNLLTFASSGALALGDYNLYLPEYDLDFTSTSGVVLTNVALSNTGTGVSIDHVWTTSASAITSTTLTFRYPTTESTSTTMSLWYKDTTGDWTYVGDYTATDGTDGYMYVTATGVTALGTDRQWTFSETEDTLEKAYANIKVYMQGPYIVGGGNWSYLTSSLPLVSPYGDITITALPTIASPDSLVDWVYIQLRETATGALLHAQSAFLLNSGYIVNPYGVAAFTISTGDLGPYYVVVRHRNHLGIQSYASVTFKNNPTGAPTLDLTGTGSIYGGPGGNADDYGAKKMQDSPVIQAMWAGDADHNENVQPSDDYLYWRVQSGQSGYKEGDFNLNGVVQPTDKYYWFKANSGKASLVPAVAK